METVLFAKPIHEKEVGDRFIDCYRGLGYQQIPGSSLLDDSVPMSFVMSAGMVQFERFSDSSRDGDHFVLIQNSFRYFDLEQVGNTDSHLSLFRMPGAFDFGPVDHARTVSQIWTLLTEVFGFKSMSLYATYFSGDTVDGQEFPPDRETAAAWHSVGLPVEHLVGLPAKFNFWRQTRDAVGHRNSRKRGPNTEVFFDRGVEYACGTDCFPGCPCGRFVEFLNTLFITHGLDDDTGLLKPLAEPFTEVVIGLERTTAILQGKRSVFEIDTIYPLIQQVRCFSKPLPVDFKALEPTKLERTLVDHLRALLFLVADGAPPPGKGGRARLIRILIREFLTSQRLLGISDRGFVRSMILTALEYYPHTAAAQDLLLEYMSIERERFERTIQAGMAVLEDRVVRQGPRLNLQTILSMEKERGLPSPLIRYQLWQKRCASVDKDTGLESWKKPVS